MSTAVALIDTDVLTPAIVFAPKGVEAIISKVEAEVRAIDRDISTDEGRKAVRSLAYKVARSKTALDEMGKELVADVKKQAAAIDADRRTIRDRLDALQEEVRGPLTAWETAEADRIALHESALVFLAEAGRFTSPPSAAQIADRIESVQTLAFRDWQEFQPRGDVAISEARLTLDGMLSAAEQAERDAAELAELRKMKAEREELDRIEAEAKAKAEQARLIEEARAAREAQETAAAIERERIRAEQQAERDRQNAERAEREKIEAAARAVEQERERVARAKADDDRAQEKRAANIKRRAKIGREVIDAFMGAGMTKTDAEMALTLIIAGGIPHVSISY